MDHEPRNRRMTAPRRSAFCAVSRVASASRRAVLRSCPVKDGSAPCLRSSSTICGCSFRAANISAERPWYQSLALAPRASSAFTCPTRPFSMAAVSAEPEVIWFAVTQPFHFGKIAAARSQADLPLGAVLRLAGRTPQLNRFFPVGSASGYATTD